MLVEGTYFSYQIFAYCKWGVPETGFRFTLNVVESFCVLNFIAYCAYTLVKKTGEGLFVGGASHNTSNVELEINPESGESEKPGTDYYELFVLVCFLLIILLQIVQIFNAVF